MRSGRTVIITNDSSAKARSNFMARKTLDSSARTHVSKRSRRGALSISSIASYFGVFLLITTLIAVSYQPVATERSSALANASPTTQTTTLAKVQSEAGSVDPVVAANIASSLADTTNMPVSNNVANLSQSLAVETMMAQTDSSTISKPQVVNMTADSRSTTTYVTQAGDTLDGVAEKYGLKKTTIAWANNLSSDALEPNVTLTILPTDGILYTTKDGDTLDAIAEKYGSKKSDIVTYNDLELSANVASGTRLIIPGGVLPENERPGYAASSRNANSSRRGVPANSNWGAGTAAGAASSFRGVVSAGNKYAWGNCTWYAYERRIQLGLPVGSYWGNASTWAYNARAAGLMVDGTPSAGAIMANGGGYGHVAIVESVNPGVSVTISEMNGYRWGGGFNRVGRGTLSWSEATSGYYKYIH